MLGKSMATFVALSLVACFGHAALGAAPDYVEGRRAAIKLVSAGDSKAALAAFEALAAGKLTPLQQSDALEQASQAALRLKDADRALALAKSIPLPAYSKLAQMRILNATQRSTDLVKQFGDDDLSTYPDMILGDAAFFRGSAWFVVKEGVRAEKDFLLAAEYATEGNLRGEVFLHLGTTYRSLLKDDARAIAAYRRTYDTINEFKRSSAAVAVSSILLTQGKVAEAKAELERVDERQMTIPAYRDAWLKAKQAVNAAASDPRDDVQTTKVEVTEVDGGIRFAIDGKLFTEWRTGDWVAPYLYPVIGPTGENITRHYPMKAGFAGEEQDHPWHRSIRFSHSDVNGFNFWWAPGKKLAGHTAEIKLAKIEKLTSGATGEAIFWNDWLGDGKLVLRERVRLAVTPLPRGETLLDYDFELHAGAEPVTLGDKRDGGLLVRVANSMKVEDEKGNKFAGTIENSRGDKNTEAWGKRAEWTDYFGPDAAGRTVGIALFDHPSNERFPTHWHARTYGLMTANRFGTDHFKGKYGDHRTLICAPSKGANCPACVSHSGDYVIQPKTSLALKHRFYFHHGDAKSADVAARYRQYTADPKSTVALLKSLMQQYFSARLVEQYATTDFTAWPPEFAAETREALRLRASAYSVLRKGAAAEADYQAALKLDPKDSAAWMGLADNYANTLDDGKKAVAAYRHVLKLNPINSGWMPIYATLSIAREAIDRGRPEEAFELLHRFDTQPIAPVWRLRLLRTYGHAYAAQGKEAESLAKFREALELERGTAPK